MDGWCLEHNCPYLFFDASVRLEFRIHPAISILLTKNKINERRSAWCRRARQPSIAKNPWRRRIIEYEFSKGVFKLNRFWSLQRKRERERIFITKFQTIMLPAAYNSKAGRKFKSKGRDVYWLVTIYVRNLNLERCFFFFFPYIFSTSVCSFV